MSKREKRREQRKREFFKDKRKAASTPEQRAAVEWDRVRAEIRDLPDDQRDEAWKRLTTQLAKIRNVTERELHM